MDTEIDTLCGMCDKSQSQVCGRCRSSRYCSRECQQADWPSHKLLCKSYASLPARPGDDYFIAISFPSGAGKLKILWLHCPWKKGEDMYSNDYQYPDLASFLGKESFPRTIMIQKNLILQRSLGTTIHLGHRDTFLIDGSSPNESVKLIAGTEAAENWRGPLIAFGTDGVELNHTKCRDLNMVDFRSIVDFFISHGTRSTDSDSRLRGKKIAGVKINCLGDQMVYKVPKFEAVEVPASHPIFRGDNQRSEIAARIGLPILTRKYPPDRAWADENKWDKLGLGGESPMNNQAATFLWLCCDKQSDLFGWALPFGQGGAGSVLVVREDRKPLLPLHTEALSRYCQFEARPLLGHSQGEYAPEEPMSRDQALTCISRPTFVIFYSKLQEEKGEYEESPYRI